MKILMLNPPFMAEDSRFSRNSRSPAVSKGGCFYYPIWLSYATGWLEKQGHDVKLIDAPASKIGMDKVLEIVQDFKPELTVIDTSTPSINSDVRVLEAIKQKIKTFGVLVGPHVSAATDETFKLSKEIDAITRMEYDFTLAELAIFLEKNKPLNKCDGLSFRDENGKIIHNKQRAFITGEELDQFPFIGEVYKKHLNYKDYFYPSVLYPEITIVTGRGCPNMCTFCVLPQTMTGRRYRARSVKNVVDEFEWISKNYPDVKDIMIEDDTFPADKKRINEICDEIIRRKLKITFTCNARADIDLETLKKMKKAGCREMCLGFESGDQQILNNIKKGTRIEKIREFMKDTKKAGVLVHGCFILGNQGETKETLEKTAKFARELDPDTAQFFPLMVYPGTESFKHFSERNQLTTLDFSEWLDSQGNHRTIISRPGLTDKELVEAADNARMQFYMRPSYIGKKFIQAITNPKDMPRIIIGGANLFNRFISKKIFGEKEK